MKPDWLDLVIEIEKLVDPLNAKVDAIGKEVKELEERLQNSVPISATEVIKYKNLSYQKYGSRFRIVVHSATSSKTGLGFRPFLDSTRVERLENYPNIEGLLKEILNHLKGRQ